MGGVINWKRNAGVFVSSQIISLFGSSLVQYAITWYITLKTQSGIYATVSILCGFIPTFLLLPFAGVWADRYNKKLLIILADGGIALCTLGLAISFWLGYEAIWLLFVASAIRSLGSAVQTPCVNALLPSLVPTDKLTRVNGINGSLQSLTLVSPMLSGALMGLVGIRAVFLVDVATAALAILVLILFLHIPAVDRKQADTEATAGYTVELRKGFSYIAKSGYLLRFFLYTGLLYLLCTPVSFLTSLQVARTYGEGVWQLTASQVAFSLGMVCGGLVLAMWGGFKNRATTMGLSVTVMGFGTFALGIAVPFWSYAAIMLGIGLFLPMFTTTATVFLQERVKPDYLGRVFGVLTMLSTSIMPMAMLVFGPLADAIAIKWLMLISGVGMALLGVFLLTDRKLHTLSHE
jgi:DHA3 family macrolide efflux protein-like MFS transporter